MPHFSRMLTMSRPREVFGVTVLPPFAHFRSPSMPFSFSPLRFSCFHWIDMVHVFGLPFLNFI